MAQAFLLRPRLLRRLLAALEVGHVLMVAPAGYGKTTLLRSLASHRPHTYYLALTPGDVDLAHFRARFQQAAPSTPDSLLLLDDVHHLEGGTQAMGWLVQQLARPAPRLVLSGRSFALPPELASEAVDTLSRLTAEELAFTWDECQALLAERHRDLTSDELMAWHQRTEGWPMALALLSHWASPVSPGTIRTELFPYLAESLLDGLPPELRRYLYVTAVPLRFNDALARVLLGQGERAVQLRGEVQRRNLFLQPAELPDWFRYHELVREFLLQTAPFDLASVFERTVAWFDAQGDPEMAIEHALAGRLFQEAAERLLQLPEEFVWAHSRQLTYRRWVLALDEPTRTAHPNLLSRLGMYLHFVPGYREEAWHFLTQGLDLAEAQGDAFTRCWAYGRAASLLFREARYAEAMDFCNRLLRDPDCNQRQRMFALRISSLALGRLARFPEARTVFQETIALAQELDDPREEAFQHTNFAIAVLIPLGDFTAAQHHLEQAPLNLEGPGVDITILLNWCELYATQGDWDGLRTVLERVEGALEEVEVQETSQLLWCWYYRALWATARGQFDQAEAARLQAVELAREDPFAQGYLARLAVYMERRQGRFQAARRRIDQALSNGSCNIPLQRALLALERGILDELLSAEDGWLPALHPETANLVRWRARSELVRLRALLALRCWRVGDPRWRRHLRAALRALQRPGYGHLLTRRDPDLGARFWTVALAEGVAVDRAVAALQEIDRPDTVARLFRHPEPGARARAARVLATMGHETSMPLLAEALAAEQDPETASSLEAALAHLESRPPPPLRVRLMGTFALWRGGERIPEQAWPRPLTRRVFQYFALHQGVPLSRDRILDDLWPGMESRKAWATFRTVYSQLRRVLDPHMRPRMPARYFTVEDETYCFDPDGHSQVDVAVFRTTVRQVLDTAHRFDIPPLPTVLMAALESWEPLLPDLPYAEWLLEAREQLHGLYAEGCLYAAQALLVRDRPPEATIWARRAVATAPWMEEGYQILMRAYARQGKRSLALRTYAQAVDRLRQELDTPPSPLTQWLAERVRRGEAI